MAKPKPRHLSSGGWMPTGLCRRAHPFNSRYTLVRARVTCKLCLRAMPAHPAAGISGFVPDDYDLDVGPVYEREQSLWLCTWGTQTALVWAATAQWAEARVRRRAFDRRLSDHKIMRLPQIVDGPILVRPATPQDLERWTAAGGPKV
jgi:hypothetical protein